jgi:hypothetical protein
MVSTNSGNILKRIFSDIHREEASIDKVIKKFEDKAKQIIYSFISAAEQVQVGPAISAIPAQGIKIEQPGTYYLTNDIIWLPESKDKYIAINITCSDVILDLNGYKITAVCLDHTAKIVGINAGSLDGCQNITIQNGELINMSLHGISAGLISNLNIGNITVKGSEYTYFGDDPLVTASGIYVEFSNYVNITRCTITGVKVTAPAYAGIQLFASTNATVSNCYANNLVNQDGTVTGFSNVEGCKHVLTLNCHSSEFRSHYQANPLGTTTTFGHTVLGFLPTGCSDLHYENCTATNLRGCCDDCHGMSIFDSNDVTVFGFRASGIVDGDAPVNTGAKATGLEVYGNNILVKFCVVENIFAIVPQDKQSCGFSAAGNNITFESCVANNVLVFDENRNPTNNYDKYGYGIGFGWAPDPREPFIDMYAKDTIYLNCSSNYCQVGFDTWNHINGTWENWTAENCNIDVLQQPNATRIFSMNNCSELPQGMASPIIISNHSSNNTFIPQLL